MAEGLNRVMQMGNLAQDPELRYTQGGQAVLNMRLAVSESYKDSRTGEWKENVQFFNVVLWGKRAEALGKFLTKGAGMFVEGSLRNSSFEGKDGVKRYKTEINARNVILTGKRGDSGGSGYQQQPAAHEQVDQQARNVAAQAYGEDNGPPSSIPF